MEEQQAALLQRYRRDRRKLLEFLLSTGSISQSRSPLSSPAGINLDTLSTDYIIQCLKSGGVIDVTEATNKYFKESSYPVTSHSLARDSYFLVSDPNIAGSPPRRTAPPVSEHQTTDASQLSRQTDHACGDDATSGNVCGPRYNVAANSHDGPSQKSSEISRLGLPSLNTGLSDDDLRESAYELLLASIFLSGTSGVEAYSGEDRKKEKSSKFLHSLKSKREKMLSQSHFLGRNSEFIDTIRVQMQISETMDSCIRRNLTQLAARGMCGQIDLSHISLGLLNGVFKSDFRNEKSYIQWKNRQANILEEFLCFSSHSMTTEHLRVRSYVGKIKDEKEWDAMSPSERVAILASIKLVAVSLSSLPGRFGIEGETFYWAASYHLNIRLYEKLLFGLFDVLDEGQLIEEADEILSLLRLTWSVLGITEKLHYALYGWVLFQQFVETDAEPLLEYAVHELQKVLSTEEADGKEQYMNSLGCSRQYDGHEIKLNVASSICLSISIWSDSVLEDYHLHFGQKPSSFGTFMTLVSAIGVLTFNGHGKIKLTKSSASSDNVSSKIIYYVNKSTEAVYGRVAYKVDVEAKVQRTHPLAMLAKELKLIAEREFDVFWPVLRQWCPESLMKSIALLHQYYGERLKSFLKGVSSLSEDVRLVLPAAKMLDDYLTQLRDTNLEANCSVHSPNQTLHHYQIGQVSMPLVLDWVISQHTHILEWTERTFDIEDWEPLSLHQRQAASVVEVFRIMDETVDQFFGLNLPMNITHLQALLSVIFHSLNTYLMRMLDQLVERNQLYPCAPPLTRYTESVIPVIKKRLLECAALDDDVNLKLNELTTSKLCIRLNTLQYILKQIGILEDGIRKSWALIKPSDKQRCTKDEPLEDGSLLTHDEAIDALFATTFSIIKDTAAGAIDKICVLTGARVVFWDLRDKFLFYLYHGDVESSRLESFLPHIDAVLDLICGLIDDALRDRLVLSIFQATMEAYVWILLDGGPSRAFSDSDVSLMEDDFNILKDFFIANGQGLPRSLVEQEAKLAQQILGIFSLTTDKIIRMLMDASEHVSVGSDSNKHGRRLEDADTLLRILCHKKDREASKFLKRQYQFPMSSEYDEASDKDSTVRSQPLISDLLKRSYSTDWTKHGQSSFKSIKKKLQEATSEFRNVAR